MQDEDPRAVDVFPCKKEAANQLKRDYTKLAKSAHFGKICMILNYPYLNQIQIE